MKASELRIGNYLQDKSSGRNLIVVELKYDDTIFVIPFGKEPIESIELAAIPFTKEWFDKAKDFKFDNDSLHLALCEVDTANEYNFSDAKAAVYKYVLFINGGLGDQASYGARIEIKEVHQLQNICFALTGVEIPFSL